MGHCIVKLGDKYCEWSTVVDAPVMYFMDRVSAVRLFGEDRVARADQYGDSMNDRNYRIRPLIFNRAGPHERRLTLKGLLAMYASCEAERAAHQMKELPESWWHRPDWTCGMCEADNTKRNRSKCYNCGAAKGMGVHFVQQKRLA